MTLLKQFKCHIIKAEQLTTAVAGSATETHNNDNQQLQKMHTNTPPSTIGDSAEQMFSYQISHECCIAGGCNVQAKFVAKLLHSPCGFAAPSTLWYCLSHILPWIVLRLGTDAVA